jgi:hypothetical protein
MTGTAGEKGFRGLERLATDPFRLPALNGGRRQAGGLIRCPTAESLRRKLPPRPFRHGTLEEPDAVGSLGT